MAQSPEPVGGRAVPRPRTTSSSSTTAWATPVGDQLLVAVADRLKACRPRRRTRPPGSAGDEFTVLLEDVPTASDASDRRRAHRSSASLSHSMSTATGPVRGRERRHRRERGPIGPEPICCAATRPRDVPGEAERQGPARDVRPSPMETGTAGPHRARDRTCGTPSIAGEFRRPTSRSCRSKRRQSSSVEAPLRWKHPVRGLISPDEFIPVAEETGTHRPDRPMGARGGLPPGRRVPGSSGSCADRRSTCCREPLSPPVPAPGLLDDVDRALKRGRPPTSRLLTLEITESIVMKDPEARRPSWARSVKHRRAASPIDDFGTGYSSLAYLKHFPVDYAEDRPLLRERPGQRRRRWRDRAEHRRSGTRSEPQRDRRGHRDTRTGHVPHRPELRSGPGRYPFDRPMPAEDVAAALDRHARGRSRRVA